MSIFAANSARVDRLLEREEAKQSTISKPLAPRSAGYLRSWEELAMYAGFSRKQFRVLLTRLVVVLALTLCLALLISRPVVSLFALLWILVERFRLKIKASTRSANFERDYTALSLSLASSIRTGSDPLSALLNSGELFPASSEMRKELENFRKQIEQGDSEEEAISNFATTLRSE